MHIPSFSAQNKIPGNCVAPYYRIDIQHDRNIVPDLPWRLEFPESPKLNRSSTVK